MKIFIASYEDASGHGYQKIFYTKKSADDWMYRKFVRDFCCDYGMSKEEKLENFKNHKRYGAFTGKIKKFNIKSK